MEYNFILSKIESAISEKYNNIDIIYLDNHKMIINQKYIADYFNDHNNFIKDSISVTGYNRNMKIRINLHGVIFYNNFNIIDEIYVEIYYHWDIYVIENLKNQIETRIDNLKKILELI